MSKFFEKYCAFIFHFYGADFEVVLVSRTSYVLPSAESSTDLNWPFDEPATSVDVLAVLIYFEDIQWVNDTIRQKWVDLYSSTIDKDRMKCAHVAEERRIIYDEHQREP